MVTTDPRPRPSNGKGRHWPRPLVLAVVLAALGVVLLAVLDCSRGRQESIIPLCPVKDNPLRGRLSQGALAACDAFKAKAGKRRLEEASDFLPELAVGEGPFAYPEKPGEAPRLHFLFNGTPTSHFTASQLVDLIGLPDRMLSESPIGGVGMDRWWQVMLYDCGGGWNGTRPMLLWVFVDRDTGTVKMLHLTEAARGDQLLTS